VDALSQYYIRIPEVLCMSALSHSLLQRGIFGRLIGTGAQGILTSNFASLFLFLLLAPGFAAPLAVTGQWDFKFGDLRATIGADLQYINDTSNLTTFGIMKVNGGLATVMGYGSNSPSQGYYMRHGAKPNGGGQFVNQYTLVMDMMCPGGAGENSSIWTPLVQANTFNSPGTDAEFYFGTTTTPGPDGIGPSSQMSASLSPYIWYRLGLVVDLTAPVGQQLTKYLNGVLVGSQNLSGGIDGQYALGPTALLFTTGLGGSGTATQPGFVNSIQFINGVMSSNAMAALGGPAPAGIPCNDNQPLIQLSHGGWQSPSTKFTWMGRTSSTLQLQLASDLASSNWQTIGTFSTVNSLTLPSSVLSGTMGFLRASGPLPSTSPAGVATEPDIAVGHLATGEQSIPTKQLLRTPGQSIYFSGRPVDIARSPNGNLFFIKNNNSLLVVNASSWRLQQTLIFPASAGSMHGIAVNPAGTHVYVTGAVSELYDYTISNGGTVAYSQTINLLASCNPNGVAISANGSNAYVCLTTSNYLAVVNLSSTNITQLIKVGVAPWDVVLSNDGNTAYVSDWGGRQPGAGDLTGYFNGIPIIVDNRGIAASGAVSVVDLTQNLKVADIPTGLHPNAQTLSSDGTTLYVANANSDTVTVINTQARAVQETILMRPNPSMPFGSASDGLALSPDGTTLYVANAGNNAVGIVQLPNAQHTNSVVQGFVPSDWYPGAVMADATDLYVVNVKGLGSGPGTAAQLNGSVNKIPLPNQIVLSKYTAQVQENGRVPQMLQTQLPAQPGATPVPVPAHVGEPSVFEHVLYIIKENKTYDEMFGDMTQGNGNSNLCIFGQSVSPNHHALASQFVLLDNYYCNGVYSTDGHSWCTEANSTDYWEKAMNTINRGWHQGTDPLIYSSSGFIWDNVLQHNLTLHNFGVLGNSFPQPSSSTWLQVYSDYTNHTGKIWYTTYIGCPPNLPRYSSTNVSGFNLAIPDQMRADGWLAEFNAAQSNGVWPTFNLLYLPDDHTAASGPGYPTPRAQVADNDLALGRVVDAVTKSVFWTNTVVFVIEDDPQGGYDHVDGHRSICLVISPYTRRAQTVSTFYNQVGLLHTMEQIMGLPPMNQMDAMGPLMTDCFMTTPDFTPYNFVANNVALNEMNPGTTGALSRKERYWARLSQKMDISKPDQVDDNLFNRIIWHSVKGDARYPAEFAGAHGKGFKKLGLITSKPGKDPDDD
jgi:YVTN family beta-propeller protein